MNDQTRGLYGRYNAPPETPREEMWDVIAERIREGAAAASDDEVSLAAERRARRGWPAARSWAAAAAVLVIGVALGRASAPEPTETATAGSPVEVPGLDDGVRPTSTALDFAAFEHLGRSESLLAMVRADAREGRVDPAVAPWARNLLVETRLLLDARGGVDPTLDGLLAELELVLAQIVGLTEGGADEGRMRTELDLTIGGMDQREVLTRIRAVIPTRLTSE